VTLVEGKVSVASTGDKTSVPPRDSSSEQPGGAVKPLAGPYLMTPGQRLRIAKAGPRKLDEPHMEAVTAWRRGEVMLDDTLLSDAVAEMNRYNKSPLVIDEAQVAHLKVSGIYHTGDSGGFAAAVANLYGLHVTESANGIHLGFRSPASH
jgi:transmembrane sensor